MIRKLTMSVVTLAGFWFGTEIARADVFVRAPFVRVEVGAPGVWVRAPFVNLWLPGSPPVYQAVPVQPAPQAAPPAPMPPVDGKLPAPQIIQPPNGAVPVSPQPLPAAGGIPSLEQFSRTFQPKAGNFDVTVINPVTSQPTQVKFTLPEGSPRRVILNHDEIEFRYTLRQWVRIQFDKDGAVVTSR